MPISYSRLDSWFWAVLRGRYIGEIPPPEVPYVFPATGGSRFSIESNTHHVVWFLPGWHVFRVDAATYRAYYRAIAPRRPTPEGARNSHDIKCGRHI